MLLEDLAWGPVAEAAPGRVVEPIGKPAEAGASKGRGLGLAWQEAANPPVRILDASFRHRQVDAGEGREAPLFNGCGLMRQP